MDNPAEIHRRRATTADASALGRLWWLTFPDKFGPAFGDDPARNARLLADLHRAGGGRMLRSTIVAEAAGQVVGFLLTHPRHERFSAFPLVEGCRTLHRHLGTLAALRALLKLAVLEVGYGSTPRHLAAIEMLGVDPKWWGRGVGRALMREAIGRAQAAGEKGITLEVVWGNDRARRLYEGLGFEAVTEQRTRLAARHFGHLGWTRMVLSFEGREAARAGAKGGDERA